MRNSEFLFWLMSYFILWITAFISSEKDSHHPILTKIYCFDFVHLLHNMLNLNKKGVFFFTQLHGFHQIFFKDQNTDINLYLPANRMTWAPRAASWLRTIKAGTECLLLLLRLLGSKKTCPGNHHSFLTPLIVLLFSPLLLLFLLYFSL